MSWSAGKNPEYRNYLTDNLKKINYHINDLSSITGIKPGTGLDNLNYHEFNEFTADEAKTFLDSLKTVFRVKSRACYYSAGFIVSADSSQNGRG